MKKTWLLAAGLMLVAASAYAAKFSVYPGSRLEIEEMKSAEEAQADLPAKVRKSIGTSQIYTTDDGFKPVYNYYQKRYPETDLDIKKTRVKISTGQIISDAYFCLDGAKSVRESKHYLKIMSPRPAVFLQGNAGAKQPKIPERTLIQVTDKP